MILVRNIIIGASWNQMNYQKSTFSLANPSHGVQVGDVKDRVCVLLDDMSDSCGTLCKVGGGGGGGRGR